MARENLNNSEYLVTITTTASKSIHLRGSKSASIEIPPFRPNLLSKSISKCEHCEIRFTLKTVFENIMK